MADRGTEGLLSPYLRRKRIDAVRPHLKGSVLDIGCGSGALAEFVSADSYVGFDIDRTSIDIALQIHPGYAFTTEMPDLDACFDTIVVLAVIEHVADPTAFLRDIAVRLAPEETSSVVCTTPHPSAKWIHDVGAALGLFSRHAKEEHEALLNRSRLTEAGVRCGLNMVEYRRFLFLTNQLAVFQRSKPGSRKGST